MRIPTWLAALVVCAAVTAEEPPPLDPQVISQALFSAASTSAVAKAEQASPRHLLPAVPGADADSLQGFIRIVNRNDEEGEVTIHAIDDTGRRFGPATLWMNPWQARHFNSEDLENGNPEQELSGGVGNGTGWWRVEMTTTLRTRAFSYIRTPDGFVTSMHEVADELTTSLGDPYYRPPFFNPAKNTDIQSWLRIINPNDDIVAVLVGGMDDTGYLAPPVTFPLLAGEAIFLSARQLRGR